MTKKFKITILFKSNQSVSFECDSFDVKQSANKVKSIDCEGPDENYPTYLDLSDIDAIISKKIAEAAGFKNALGFRS